MPTIAIKIDPSGAVGPAREIRRSLDDVANAGARAEKSVASMGKGHDGARIVRRSIDDVTKAASGMARTVAGANDNVARSAQRLSAAYDGVNRAATLAAKSIGTITGSLIVTAITRMADAWSDMRARVGIAIKDMNGADAVLNRIAQTARMTYSDLALTAEGFVRNATVLNELGKSTKQQLDYQEALNNALVVSGAKGRAAEFVQESLNRSMALGAMRGIELNNVLNYGGRIAELLAKHFNTTTGGLMKLAQEGKITGEVLFNVLTKNMVQLREEAESMPATISDGFTLIRNSVLQTVGVFDQANKLSQGFATNLVAIADNMDTAMKIAGAAVLLLAARMTGPLVGAFAATTLAGTRSIAMLGIYDVATRRLNVSLTAATAAARAFSGAMALVGGPAGAAIIVLGGAMYLAARNAQEASARSDRYAEAIKQAGENSNGASGGIREAARSLQELKTGATEAENAVTRAMAQTDIAVSNMTMAATIQKLGATMGWASVEIQKELQDVRRSFFDGQITAEKFVNKVDEISRLHPDASPIIAEIQKIAREAAAAMGIVDAFNKSLAGGADAKGDRLVPKLSDDDFNRRSGGRYAKTWKELFPDLFKEAKTEAEKFQQTYDKLIRSGEQHVFMLGEELRAVGASRAEWEGYRFATDLYYRAAEAAAQNNQTLTDEQIKKIKELGVEYTKLAQAVEEARLKSDLVFEQAQLGRSETEQRVADALRGVYGDKYVDHMDGAIAGTIRLVEEQRKLRAELDDINDAVKDTFTGLIDLLYSSGDATEKLIGAFAQLGKMFAKMGAEKLYDFISGKSSSLFGGSVPSVGGSASVANYRVSGQAIGETIAPPIVESLNSGLDTYAAAIRKIESGSYGGNYGAAGPVVTSGMYAGDRAYGAYQVMGNNIASWTKEVLGQSMTISQFLGDKMAQDKVFYAKFGQSVDKYGSVADAISVWFSGRPLSRAGNASDGYNTVPAYVSKVQSAADAYPGGLPKAVSDGMVDATKRIRVGSSLQQDVFDTSSSTSVAGGGMTKMQGLLGVGGAAFGAFAGGYQSGDPLSGAIGGAMAGLGATSSLSALGLGAAAGPVGIIGGAIIGLIGGLLGKAKQKKQEMKQAQQELESQMGAITQLIATATGNFMGSFEKSFTSTTDEFQKAIALAEKAGNKVMVEKLKSSMDEFFGTLQDQWDRGFDGVLASMNAGLGFDGEFVKGSDAVEKMRESLVGFVNDAKFFAEANGDLASMLDARKNEFGIGTTQQTLYRYQPHYREPGKDGSWVDNTLADGYLDIANQMVDLGVAAFTRAGGQLYPTLEALKRAATDAGLAIDEQGKVTRELKAANDNLADSVERAREGAQATALAMLSGGKEFTEVEKAIQRLEGAAATLPSLLEDLGMSAEEAAKAIEHHLNIALRDLRNNLTTDLTRSINDLAGFGYLNDLLDAQTAYESRVRDLQALGMDTGLAMQELGLRLANIAKEAELTDDILRQLADAFPQLSGSLLGLVGGNLGTTSQALQAAKDDVEKAKDALRRAYENEIGTLEKAKSAHESYVKSIKDFLDSIRLDSNLSPLDPTQRFQEAQRNYLETTQQALAGNEDAIGKVEEVSRQYLEEARAYYGTSEGYFAIFNDVEATLNSVLNSSQKHLSELEQQLAAMEAQRDAQLGTTDAVLSVEEAINRLAAATSAQAAAQQAYDQAQDAAIKQMLELLKQTGQAYDPFVTSLYRDVLGRSPDAEGAAYYTNMLKSGVSQEEVRRRFTANAQPELDRGYPVFADGGYHMGGLRLVGERGPELEMTGPSRIWSAADTSRILSQAWQPQRAGNDNSAAELAREVKALREQNAKLLEQLIDVSAAGSQATVGAVQQTTDAVKEQTSAARREGGRRAA